MTQYDTLIIGSGAGGLTAAVALAQAGQKVLVCEQHDVPGGWTHSFTLNGYRFSPGVHYIGGIEAGKDLTNKLKVFGRIHRPTQGAVVGYSLPVLTYIGWRWSKKLNLSYWGGASCPHRPSCRALEIYQSINSTP